MNVAADIILPVFGLIAFGYIAGRLQWIRENAIEGLSTFVFTFAIPVLLFRSVAIAELPASLPWTFLIAYYGPTLLIFLITLGVARRLAMPGTDASILAMTASYSNVVLVGIPVILAALGEDARVPLFIIISTHAAVMFVLTTLCAELGQGHAERLRDLPVQTLQVLAKNMIVVGLALGLVVNLSGLALPQTVDNMTGYLGDAALPCAVFSMGASISRYQIRGEALRIGASVAVKNLLHPLMVWLACTLVFSLPKTWTVVLVVLAACPSGINAYLFANRYQALVASTATTVVVSTAVSIVVISGVLLMLISH